jgi:excisionase family DNA binding protein
MSDTTDAAPRARRSPHMPDAPKDAFAYRINHGCALIGVSRAKLYDLHKLGKVKFIRIGGRVLIARAELERLVSEASNGGEA